MLPILTKVNEKLTALSTDKIELETNSENLKAELDCTKCSQQFQNKEQFYVHILVCGGDEFWDVTKKKGKKAKKRGHGGGLKSLVMKLKQKNADPKTPSEYSFKDQT